MLEDVRRSAKSGLSYILVAGLIVIFAFFFGVPADSCSAGAPGARMHVANVAGDDVHTDDLNVIYNQVYGTRQRGEEPQIQQQQALALKAYLIIEMLAHKAREAGLRVDDDEFRAYMQDPLRNPEFLSAYGQNGTWDGEFYQRYVQNLLRVNISQYEDFKRDELLARKYLNLVDMQIGVLPQEVASMQALRDTEIDLEYVKFSPEALTYFVEVDESEVAEFVSQNQDEIEAYYEEHAEKYSEPAQMEVRRIYLERGSDNAEERFEQAKERLDEGEDFATVAGEINDALREKQGLMQMTSVENMSQDIVEALEDAEIGDVREVTNENELILVKLTDKQEAVETPLSQVQDDIGRTLLQQQKADTLIAELSDQLIEQAKESGTLSEAVAALRSDAEQDSETPSTEADDDEKASQDIWASVEVGQTGEFTLEGQDMSGMFGGQLPPGVSLGRTPWDRIPEIGQNRKLAVDAFTNLSEESPLAEQAYDVDDGSVVVRLRSKTQPSDTGQDGDSDDQPTDDEAELELVEELRNEKLSDLVGQWQRLFQRRTQTGAALTLDYGPWIERQYEAAVESGLIELESDAGPIVALIHPNASAEVPPAPGMGAPGQDGAPIEVTPTGESSE